MDDTKPVFLKLGVSLAVPLAAYLVSGLRFRNSNKPPNSRCNLPSTVGCDRGLKDALRAHQDGEALFNIIHGASATPATNSTVLTSTEVGITCEKSPSGETSAIAERLLSPETYQPSDPLCYPAIRCSGDEDDDLLLQEAHQQSDQEPADDATLIAEINHAESDDKEAKEEQEIALLSNMFQSLWEMDTLIQIEMLELHGRQEQDEAVRDLENRLRASVVEAERLQAEIESLQNENQMLNMQASLLLMNMEELESEKAKAKLLQRKLKSMRARARVKLRSFEERIGVLQRKLQMMERDEAEARSKSQRLRDVEVEVDELRTRNVTLSQENADLVRRLESAQAAAISCSLETSQVKVQEEANQTREANFKKTEQLNAEHFGDDEFMYLRWLSAQLRYETKEHIPWKTAARSLSRPTSPESENKAAEFALDSANECANIECCLPPKEDVTTIDKPSLKRDEGSQKPKFFRKFKKLLARKSGDNSKVSPVAVDEHPSGCNLPGGRESVSDCSIDDAPRSCSSDSMSSCFTGEHSIGGAPTHDDDKWQNTSAWIQASYKSPLDVTGARKSTAEDNSRVAHCMSDLGASGKFTRMGNGGGKLTLMDLLPNIMSR